MQALKRMAVQPGVIELCTLLDSQKIPRCGVLIANGAALSSPSIPAALQPDVWGVNAVPGLC